MKGGREFEILLQSIADVNGMLGNLEELLSALLDHLYRAMSFYSGSIQLYESGACRIVAYRGALDDATVRDLRFPLAPRFPNYHVIESRRPVCYDDVRTVYPHFLVKGTEYSSGHIRSWLGVPMAAGASVFGMITLDRDRVYPFTPAEIRLAEAFADNAAIAIRNARLYRELQDALASKERLMREMNHRTKNGLQLVTSLVSLEASKATGEEARRALMELMSRIDSIAAAHELLCCQDDPMQPLALGRYLSDLTDEFQALFLSGAASVAVRKRMADLRSRLVVAVPLGLIMNELLTNAAKYAFPDGRRGTIAVELAEEGAGGILMVEDDGIGFDPAAPARGSGVGLDSVRALASQIGGSAELESAPGRTRWTIRFPLEAPEAEGAASACL